LPLPRALFELTHQPAKPLERPRDPHARVDLDQDPLGGLYVDLQQSGLVQRRVQEGQQALWASNEEGKCIIGSRSARVTLVNHQSIGRDVM
jgi:hypothetical protein